MSKESYPLPGQTPGRLRLVVNNPTPEFGTNREQYEERVFRQAHHYNIVRFRPGGGSEIHTTEDFRTALHTALQKNDHRYLLYVVTERGEAFCMSHKDYGKYAQIFLQMREEKLHGHAPSTP